MTDQNCGTCRFFGPSKAHCHRFPPTAQMLSDGENHLKSFFPVTSSANFCGEWAPERPAPSEVDTETVSILLKRLEAAEALSLHYLRLATSRPAA